MPPSISAICLIIRDTRGKRKRSVLRLLGYPHGLDGGKPGLVRDDAVGRAAAVPAAAEDRMAKRKPSVAAATEHADCRISMNAPAIIRLSRFIDIRIFELDMESTRVTSSRSKLGHVPGFWIIAAAFLLSMAYAAIPTPLYVIYQRLDGFATYVITIIFASYAVGVALTLYLAGHVSDWMGRRIVVLGALLLEALSSVIFLLWPEVAGLILARFISGVGIGALTSTATAHLSELRIVSHPHERGSRSSLVATVVNLGGIALGPLVSGVLAAFVRRPLVVPYTLFLLLLLVTAFGVSLVPETVERRQERPVYRPQSLSAAGAQSGRFFAAAIGAAAAFAVFGLFTSLAPSFVAGALHDSSRVVAGIVASSAFIAATVAQVVLGRAGERLLLRLGVAAMAVGLVLLAAGVLVGSVALFLLAGVGAGAGAGLLFKAAIGMAASLATARTRGAMLATAFLFAYIGLTVPVIGLGVSLLFVSSRVAISVFSAVILVAVLLSAKLAEASSPVKSTAGINRAV